MLFSSYFFILVFLPASIILYFSISKISKRFGLIALLGSSSIFYSWSNPAYLPLIYSSILFNYFIAKKIYQENRRALFILSIIVNVAILIFFKYFNFLIENLNMFFSLDLSKRNIPLPLAISFFTFQQIGFLIEVYKRKKNLPSFINFANYMTFYPQLIAGPIVKHTDYLPQLNSYSVYAYSIKNLSIGATIFAVGLFKKTVLADSAGKIADLIFGLIAAKVTPNLIEGWIGVFSYSFQIYFDFSGYSDMAIGLARMFNIYLPCNFLSPYQSSSLIEFWRKWHISLSTFLKEHIYIPLGGNRKGTFIRYQNLFITMLVGGLWHGASWTFVIWGGLHGIYLIINHMMKRFRFSIPSLISPFKRLFVFLIVSVTWVFFRANTLSEAKRMLRSLVRLPSSHFVQSYHISLDSILNGSFIVIALSSIVFFLPNLYEWLAYFRPAKDFIKSPFARSKLFKKICWKPTLAFGLLILLMFIIAFGSINKKNEFIYFRF